MMDMDKQNIKQLLDKFMDGRTSLSEERLLYEYFTSAPADDELAELKPYFVALGGMSRAGGELHQRHRKVWSRVVAVAASVAVAVIIVIGVDRSHNYCEAYVYGQRTTDKTEVMSDVATTLGHIEGDPETQVDNQLKDLFGN